MGRGGRRRRHRVAASQLRAASIWRGQSPAPRQGCRPSFLIIGASAARRPSTTTSPRIPSRAGAPKQIQFFDHAYDASRISSYLSQFPRTLNRGRGHGRGLAGYAQYSQVPGSVAKALGWGAHSRDCAGPRGAEPTPPYHYNAGSARVPLPLRPVGRGGDRLLEAFFRNGPTKKCGDKSVATSRTTATGLEARRSRLELLLAAARGEQARKRSKAQAADTAAKAARRTAVAMSLPRLNARTSGASSWDAVWKSPTPYTPQIDAIGGMAWPVPQSARYTVSEECSEDLNDADKAASEMGRVASPRWLVYRHLTSGRPCPAARQRRRAAQATCSDVLGGCFLTIGEAGRQDESNGAGKIDNFTAPLSACFRGRSTMGRWGRDRPAP